MLLLYKSYNYINKHFFLLFKSRVEGRGSRVVGRGARGSRRFPRYPDLTDIERLQGYTKKRGSGLHSMIHNI